ncbi:MAG: ion transport 2 domain protein [Marinilabiliales bacterium]|nr:MAG: ion transport 2 domain protein [Marinilabiliales bacterium]
MINFRKKLFKNWLIWGAVIICCFFIFQFGVYIAESQNPDTSIKTFADSLWYGIVTLAAVGYGDMVPVTLIGKILGSVLVLGSIALMGTLISQFTNKIRQLMENKKMGYLGTKMKDHCVIIGWDSFSMNVSKWILESGKKVAVVTNNKNDLDLIYNKFGDKNIFALFSEYSNIESYKLLNITESSSVFINFHDDSETLVRLLNIKRIYPDLNYIVSLNNPELKDTFHAAGVTFSISNLEVASKLVASYNFEPDVAYFTEDIMSSAEHEDDHDLVEYLVNPKNPYLNMNYFEAFVDLKKSMNAILMGLSRKEKDTYHLFKNPDHNMTINENDYLVVLVDGKSKKTLEKKFAQVEGRI